MPGSVLRSISGDTGTPLPGLAECTPGTGAVVSFGVYKGET